MLRENEFKSNTSYYLSHLPVERKEVGLWVPVREILETTVPAVKTKPLRPNLTPNFRDIALLAPHQTVDMTHQRGWSNKLVDTIHWT